MSLVHCRECGHRISSQATYCPHCGASPHKISMETEIRMIILLIILAIALIVLTKMSVVHNILNQNWAKKESVFSFPVASLEVTYSQSYRVAPDRIAVSGQVKNIDNKILPDVEVGVRWYDKAGNILSTDVEKVDTNPLYPGRQGNFEVLSVYTPDMADYVLFFRALNGGDIAVINKR